MSVHLFHAWPPAGPQPSTYVQTVRVVPPISFDSVADKACELPDPSIHRERLSAISGLRFLAALHLVLYHIDDRVRWLPAWARAIIGAGYTSTSFFFILSGFVLAYAYIGEDERLRVPKEKFWVARFARLYPIYIIGNALMVPVVLFAASTPSVRNGAYEPIAAALHGVLVLTATQSWFPSASTAYNGTSWAVSTLFFFYAVFPAFVAWSKRLDQRRLWTALCATWMMVLLPAVVVLVTEEGRRPPQGSIEYWLLHSLPVARLAEFLFGVVLCKLYLRGGGVRRVNGILLSAGALTALLLVLARSRELPYALLHNGLVTPLHAMIILGVASGRGGLTWVLSHPKMRVLGDASLSLYLLHVPFLYWGLFLVKKVTPLDSVSGEAAFLAGYAVLCIGASILTTRFIVDPVAVFLKDRLPGAFSGWRRRLGFLAPAMLRRRRTPERPERLLYKG